MSTEHNYQTTTDGRSTTQVAEISLSISGNNTQRTTLTYDSNGNILSVSDGTNTTSYVYDSANQLIRENNQAAGKTWVWTYDEAGNILSKQEYTYTTGTLGSVESTVPSSKQSISYHVNNCFNEGELNRNSVVKEFLTTAADGKEYVTQFYNLDAIISVGYRINSRRATHFRIWVTGILKEYMIKGFVLDDERLKQGKTAFGKDYFRELLERVRSLLHRSPQPLLL